MDDLVHPVIPDEPRSRVTGRYDLGVIDFERARIARLRRRAEALGLDLLGTLESGFRLYSPDRREYLGTSAPTRRPQRLAMAEVEQLLTARERALRPV